MRHFPNKAGDHDDTDEILTAELEAADIVAYQNLFLRMSSGEVKTGVRGALHGWRFERAWCYWICGGPGIDFDAATKLHEAHGEVVRVAGDCACRSPLEHYRGLAVGYYHVDTAEGLKALADTIKEIVARHEQCTPSTGE